MWNPFRRKSSTKSRPQEHPWTPLVRTGIATIDRIGPTAVATMVVTKLTRTEGLNQLLELFRDLSGSGAKSLVLDLQNLETLDSMCMGCLIQALNGAVRGGRIAIVNGEGKLQELFRLARLDRLFTICHDVPSALAAIERA